MNSIVPFIAYIKGSMKVVICNEETNTLLCGSDGEYIFTLTAAASILSSYKFLQKSNWTSGEVRQLLSHHQARAVVFVPFEFENLNDVYFFDGVVPVLTHRLITDGLSDNMYEHVYGRIKDEYKKALESENRRLFNARLLAEPPKQKVLFYNNNKGVTLDNEIVEVTNDLEGF